MTFTQAKAKAKKLLGDKFYIRQGEHFSSDERRKKAQDAVVAARAEITRIETEIQSRLKELDWYQALRNEQKRHRDLIRSTEGDAHYYRFDVGRSGSIFTEILGSGDTWEQAFTWPS